MVGVGCLDSCGPESICAWLATDTEWLWRSFGGESSEDRWCWVVTCSVRRLIIDSGHIAELLCDCCFLLGPWMYHGVLSRQAPLFSNKGLNGILPIDILSLLCYSGFSAGTPTTANHASTNSSLATQQRITQSDGNEILAAQRLHRPVSPHLSIYRPQITWYGSALNRITGSILSGSFYAYFALYLTAPLLGWNVGSMTVAAAFGAWPLLAKVLLKFSLAFPFTYHSLNGVRHLVWDLGMQMRNQQVAFTGWLVVGLSLVGSAVLAFL